MIQTCANHHYGVFVRIYYLECSAPVAPASHVNLPYIGATKCTCTSEIADIKLLRCCILLQCHHVLDDWLPEYTSEVLVVCTDYHPYGQLVSYPYKHSFIYYFCNFIISQA